MYTANGCFLGPIFLQKYRQAYSFWSEGRNSLYRQILPLNFCEGAFVMHFTIISNWSRGIAVSTMVVLLCVSTVIPCVAGFVSNIKIQGSRANDMYTVQRTLENKLVSERLKDLGYSEQEVAIRLSRLTDDELHHASQQLDALGNGSDASTGALHSLGTAVAIIAGYLHLTDQRAALQ